MIRSAILAASLLAAVTLHAGVITPQRDAPQPASKWWAAVVVNTRAPNTTMKLYGPFRGEHGRAKAVNECMRIQLGNPRFNAEGWKCEAMPMYSPKVAK